MSRNLVQFFLLVFLALLFFSCNKKTSTFLKPDVESFVVENNNEKFLIILAYGGSASNSIFNPKIVNENGNVKVQFSNKRISGLNHEKLYTSYRSFSGADRQASAIIELSENVNNISYLYNNEWKKIWQKKQTP